MPPVLLLFLLMAVEKANGYMCDPGERGYRWYYDPVEFCASQGFNSVRIVKARIHYLCCKNVQPTLPPMPVTTIVPTNKMPKTTITSMPIHVVTTAPTRKMAATTITSMPIHIVKTVPTRKIPKMTAMSIVVPTTAPARQRPESSISAMSILEVTTAPVTKVIPTVADDTEDTITIISNDSYENGIPPPEIYSNDGNSDTATLDSDESEESWDPLLVVYIVVLFVIGLLVGALLRMIAAHLNEGMSLDPESRTSRKQSQSFRKHAPQHSQQQSAAQMPARHAAVHSCDI